MAEEGAKRNVVVVGGGAAGTLIVRELFKKLDARQYNIILITSRSFYVHLLAMARIPVSAMDNLEEKALFGYDKLFSKANGSVKVGKVVSIHKETTGTGGEVELEDGERIPYASLVLASGSSWPAFMELPNTGADALAQISAWRTKFQNAQHVVIVGGGAVGIELAGEIRYAYPEKKITVVHRDELLLRSVYPDNFRRDIERRLRVRNIDVILGDAIDDLTEAVTGVTTKNGKSIPDADLVVPAFGSKPNTAFVKSLGDGVLNPSGYVKVSEYLEVSGHPGVYAVGDIIDWDEQKTAAKTAGHAAVVVPNLVSFLAADDPKKTYRGSPEIIMIPLGKSGGAGYVGLLGGFTIGDYITRTIKGQDLFLSYMRSQRGL